MSAETLLALAERCEKADGPDRALDRDIADALGLGPDDSWERPRSIPGVVKNMSEGSWLRGARIRDSYRYTASLDAALTLAKPSWWFNTSAPLSPDAYGYSPENMRQPRAGFEMIGEPYFSGARAATMALATCAAALRARATQGAAS